MTLILDKGLATERTLELSHYSENIMLNRLTGSKNFDKNHYPDLKKFRVKDFTTMELMEGENPILFFGDYNTITGLTMSFDQFVGQYSLSISIGNRDTAE